MTYYDDDSGLTFPSEDAYMHERAGESDDEFCARMGHEYLADDGEVGRCWCGAQMYPKGGPNAPDSLSSGAPSSPGTEQTQ